MTRSRASAKQAGSSFERRIADYMRDNLSEFIDRQVKTGSLDTGDIANVRTQNGRRVVIECKDYAGKLDMPQWLREAELERINAKAFVGVVVSKRRGIADPGQQLCSMTLETFLKLLKGEEL